MSKLRLHKRYVEKLTIAVAFMLVMIVVTVSGGWAGMQIYAEEFTTVSGSEESTEEDTVVGGKTRAVSQTGEVRVGVTGLNVRTGPGTNYSIILQVNGGLKVQIFETVQISDYKVWYKIAFVKDNTNYEGYVDGSYIELDEPEEDDNEYTPDVDFDAYLEAQKFPESYRAALKELHAKYPKWVFVADYVGIDWNTMVSKQNTVGRSLISNSSISSWKSIETNVNADGTYSSPYYNWDNSTWYPYDGNSWMQASKELLEYTLDPRNFLNETNVFMFEKLSYDSKIHTEDGVKNIIADTFMNNSTHELTYDNKQFSYSSAIMYAAGISKVSPYHLASRIRQEQGTAGTSGSISGNYGNYVGYYNYYNIGASSSADPVATGLKYASSGSTFLRPWNTRMKSIVGGATYIGNNYIAIGQDTIYYQKYDVVNYYGYLHQYMTHVLAPRSESVNASKAYTAQMKQNTALVFYIPVYDNMPETVCAVPTKDGSPNNTLAALSVEGQTITPSFGKFVQEYDLIVDYSVKSINVLATLADTTAKIKGSGQSSLKVGDNKIEVVVTAGNGDVRTYTINVVRKEAEKLPGTDGIIYGDANSDGVVDVSDCVLMKKYLTGMSVDINFGTADVNADGTVDVKDTVKIMKYIAGVDVQLGVAG